MWTNFVSLARERGHEVIMTTRRSGWSSDMDDLIPGLKVLYANHTMKKEFAESQGHKVDVWIDDDPGTIAPQKVLDTNQEI